MNRMILISFLVFFSINSYGEFPSLDQQLTEVNYSFPAGSGVVNGSEFDIELEDNSLVFRSLENEEESFVWENVPALISDLNSFSLRDAVLRSRAEQASFSLKSLNGVGADHTLKISNLLVRCNSRDRYEDVSDDLIDACTHNSVLQWDTFKTSELRNTKSLNAEMLKIAQAFSTAFNTNKNDDEINISEVRLNIKNHQISGSFKARVAGGNRKINIKGAVSYNGDRKIIAMRIDSIKYLFFNVTGEVFKELEKLESDTFIVQEPLLNIILE